MIDVITVAGTIHAVPVVIGMLCFGAPAPSVFADWKTALARLPAIPAALVIVAVVIHDTLDFKCRIKLAHVINVTDTYLVGRCEATALVSRQATLATVQPFVFTAHTLYTRCIMTRLCFAVRIFLTQRRFTRITIVIWITRSRQRRG